MTDTDCLQRFTFDAFEVRGQLVHLDQVWRAVLERHDYPPAVRDVLGQAMAATVLMASTLKFDGRMTLQIQGNGPLRLVVVQCTHDMNLRAVARWRAAVPAGDFDAQVGAGRLAITIETKGRREPYQGIVPLAGRSLGECLTAYFETSEQLPTRLWLASGEHRCAGLLLQRMPGETAHYETDDDWSRVQLLAATLERGEELLSLGHHVLLGRVFAEDDVRLYDSQLVQFRCTCTADRIETMLASLGADELESMLQEQGEIGVVCEFCNKSRRFDRVDVARLISDGDTSGETSTVH